MGETRQGALIVEGGSLVVLDARTFEERYRCHEMTRGHWLSWTKGGWFTGSTRAAAGSRAVVGNRAVPLVDLAPILFDPKRVRAAAEGHPGPSRSRGVAIAAGDLG